MEGEGGTEGQGETPPPPPGAGEGSPSLHEKRAQKHARRACYRYIYRNERGASGVPPPTRGHGHGEGDGEGLLASVTFNLHREDYRQGWFHRHATRETANEVLAHREDGAFLIRPSSQRGCYAMTFVANREIKHNLIYGLMPGFSLSEKPATEGDKYWTLTALVEHCDFLRFGVPHAHLPTEKEDESPTAAAGRSRTGLGIVGKIVNKLKANLDQFVALSWELSSIECSQNGWEGGAAEEERSSDNRSRPFRDPHSMLFGLVHTPVEKRTYVRYCGKEYVAPELLPLHNALAKDLLACLERNTTVECLSVNGHEGASSMRLHFAPNFTNREASWLAKVIRINSTLTTIDLSVNFIGDKGAAALASALLRNRTVRNLNLSSNFISRGGLIALADMLRTNTTLQELNVENQLRWDDRMHTITLQTGRIERTLTTLIHAAILRRKELCSVSSGSLFHGCRSHTQVRILLKGQKAGTFLFHIVEDMPNTLFVSFVVVAHSATPIVRYRMLHRLHAGYSFTRPSMSSALPFISVYTLRDYCLWKLCNSATSSSSWLASTDLQERLNEMLDLRTLWGMGFTDEHDLNTAGSVYGTLQDVTLRNTTWLKYPLCT